MKQPGTKFQSASQDYAYINARIRGMKSELLSSSQYQELMNAKDLSETLEILKNTHLGHHFQTLKNDQDVSQRDTSLFEEVLRRNLSETTQGVLGLLEGRPSRLFELLLTLWDVEAIKTILRGVFTRQPSQKIIESIVPAGRLSEPLLKELSLAEDVKSVIQILATWKWIFSKALTKTLPLFEEKKEIFFLENALEKAFFEYTEHEISTLKSEEKIMGTILNSLKDLFNLRAAFRMRNPQLSPSEALFYFQGTGLRLKKNLFVSLIQQETSEAACLLASSIFALPEKSKSESVIEKTLDHRVFEEGAKASLGNPLGFDIPLGFLWQKIAEIRNVRLILRGKKARLHSQKLEEELLYK
ncbi:MAG: V-type ATPase subunit [Chlamydiae bacterium]|nr:V-type ATPase subunit [Chlamydiota bacterium]MBI3266832.1 V-type ATPase subunit [Chlamydiota bacterium]